MQPHQKYSREDSREFVDKDFREGQADFSESFAYRGNTRDRIYFNVGDLRIDRAFDCVFEGLRKDLSESPVAGRNSFFFLFQSSLQNQLALHLIEHPIDGSCFAGNGFPASNASIASFKSLFLTCPASFQLSSKRPR